MSGELETDVFVGAALQESVSVTRKLIENQDYQTQVIAAGHAMARALAAGRKIMFFGNGGSAADAQHLAAELTGRYLMERPGLAGLTLTANTSAISAIANDYSFEMVFARQLEGLGQAGDVAFGITTSGKSANVRRAFEVARSKQMTTVALTGAMGAHLTALVDYCIRIPSSSTPRIQESHILTGHVLCEIIERELFP
jgi:D-sedoheptulose 7-phosphate isomerase